MELPKLLRTEHLWSSNGLLGYCFRSLFRLSGSPNLILHRRPKSALAVLDTEEVWSDNSAKYTPKNRLTELCKYFSGRKKILFRRVRRRKRKLLSPSLIGLAAMFFASFSAKYFPRL